MKREINASVHNIVDFVFAQGDILPAFTAKTSLKDGTLIHSTIQKQYDCDKEFMVKFKGYIFNYEIALQGKIDLLEKQENKYHVIEIKSTHTFKNLNETTNLAHFAQAKFYGYMLYDVLGLNKDNDVVISVMYVNKFTLEKKFFTANYSYNYLSDFFLETMEKYIAFIDIIDSFSEKKLESIQNLVFPFNQKRKGQQKLMDHVNEAIRNRQNLFVCAPTGIGKSLATIYPAIKNLENKNEKIFYLTSKSMIKDVARNAMNLLRENSKLLLKSLTITAKEKICFNDCLKCNPHDCKYACGFYSRVNDAVIDIYQNEDDFFYDNIIIYAKKYEICPFEFQLSLSLITDMIICDYNYVFDLRVYLRRFFDLDTSHIMLLIDEAHNMYDRVCNMFTQGVNFELIHKIIDYVDNDKDVIHSCHQVFHKLTQYQNLLNKGNMRNSKFPDLDEVIVDEVSSLVSKLEKYFDKRREKDLELNDELIKSYFELYNFIKLSEYFNEDFIVWVYKENEDFNYQITCLNPRYLIKMRTDSLRASVFFSATLHPVDYYHSLYGGDDTSLKLVLDSPFKQENLQLLVNTCISTKYRNREMTKYQIVYQIEELIQKGGKYLIYFPSYKYLELVYETFIKVNQFTAKISKQERFMTELDRNRFIAEFDESEKNIVGFAVLGGVFAEGIDLKGEKLNGVMIIGVGLPMFDDFRNELRQYFDKVYHKGYPYAYIYPGFNKVLQAVGRVIRDDFDQGIAVLIDDRYLSYDYIKLFPKHWSHYQKV